MEAFKSVDSILHPTAPTPTVLESVPVKKVKRFSADETEAITKAFKGYIASGTAVPLVECRGFLSCNPM